MSPTFVTRIAEAIAETNDAVDELTEWWRADVDSLAA